mmetsp:Transcript_288/g.509  ORF Transcript_288/g.509 Transcript_288/m.509 type:complete len:141 (+) Transcript_288:50-472(+)
MTIPMAIVDPQIVSQSRNADQVQLVVEANASDASQLVIHVTDPNGIGRALITWQSPDLWVRKYPNGMQVIMHLKALEGFELVGQGGVKFRYELNRHKDKLEYEADGKMKVRDLVVDIPTTFLEDGSHGNKLEMHYVDFYR